jgi:hypothetical protein
LGGGAAAGKKATANQPARRKDCYGLVVQFQLPIAGKPSLNALTISHVDLNCAAQRSWSPFQQHPKSKHGYILAMQLDLNAFALYSFSLTGEFGLTYVARS